MLNIVEFGELPTVIRRDKLLKFFQRLIAEVATVDEKEDAPCAGEFNKSINKIGSGVGLAAASGHLDEGAPFVGGEGALEVVDGFDLCGPKIGRGHLIRSQKSG